jgi:hypothetical protein
MRYVPTHHASHLMCGSPLTGDDVLETMFEEELAEALAPPAKVKTGQGDDGWVPFIESIFEEEPAEALAPPTEVKTGQGDPRLDEHR